MKLKDKILNGKKAVIFDLDGTLIYTPDDILVRNIKVVLNEIGFTRKTRKEILKFYKEHKWDETLDRWGLDSEKVRLFWQTYINYAESRTDDRTIIYEDVVPCLERLRINKVKMGVISSATPNYVRRQVKKIGEYFFEDCFSVGVAGLIKNPKPNPEGFLYFLDKLGINPDDAVSVGNSDLDTKTAKNVGCLDILIDRGENPHNIKPAYLIKSLDELR